MVGACHKEAYMLDRNKLRDGNGILCGNPGSGMCLCVKQEILNILHTTEDEVIVIDTNGEYSSLAKAENGDIVCLDNSSNIYINPFDLSLESSFVNPLSHKIDFLIQFIQACLSGQFPLSPSQKLMIEKCANDLYSKYGIANVKTSGKVNNNHVPTLLEFYKELDKYTGFDAEELRLALDKFVNGNHNYFIDKTNISFQNRLTVFDLKNKSESCGLYVGLAILEHIWNYVANSYKNRKKRNIWLYIDDADLFFTSQGGTEYLEWMFKEARTHGLFPTIVTKNPAKLLDNEVGRYLLSKSSYIQMFRLARSDMDCITGLFPNLHKYVSYIAAAKAGEGLILADDDYYSFKQRVTKDKMNYEISKLSGKERTTSNSLILGMSGDVSKKRSFLESEFKPELVPDYVKTIEVIIDDKTKKRYFAYLDTYGRKEVL